MLSDLHIPTLEQHMKVNDELLPYTDSKQSALC